MAGQSLSYASRVGDARIGEGVPNHAGEPPVAAYDFFAPPPADLGPLRSAESTLWAGGQFWTPVTRLVAAVVLSLVLTGGFVGWAAASPRSSAERDKLPKLGLLFGTVALAAGVGYALLKRESCTYVGADGAARVSVRGRRDAVPKVERVRFADAAELRAKQVRQHVNGVYTGTTYDYRWTDAAGRPLLKLRGTYRAARKKRPKAGNPFNFVRAAEVAWSNHYLARAGASLDAEGSIPFRVDAHRVVRVGPGFLEFHFGGDPARVDKADVAKVTLANGTFAFQHRDAKWFSRSGKYSFHYGAMANAQVFLFALDKLLGYRWG